jgi:hypothetical protein
VIHGADPVTELLAGGGGPGQQAVGLDGVQHGQGGRAGHRVAAERAAVVARAQRGRAPAQADARADGQPAAQALARVITSG